MEGGLSKSEIEKVILGKGDFVKITYLRRYLEKADNIETKKFIHKKLAEINQARKMYSDAITNYETAAELSLKNSEKNELYNSAINLAIQIEEFEKAEELLKKDLQYVDNQKKIDLKKDFIFRIKEEAQEAEKKNQIKRAVIFYEKLINIVRSDVDKKEIKNKLIEYYQRLGQFGDYYQLRDSE
jgi:tetratricopeptide (TPR) repeat protein